MEGGGIEISDRSVKYLRLAQGKKGGVHVVSFGEVALPPGAVITGEIRNDKALIDVLGVVRKQCKFSLCYASLPEGRGYLFSSRLPKTTAGNLHSALTLALPSHVPLAPAEAVYDCQIMPTPADAPDLSIVAGAISEQLVEQYAAALAAAGFLPLSMELEPQAAARAIVAPGESDEKAVIIADFGEAKTMLCVVEQGEPRFTTGSDGSSGYDTKLANEGLSIGELIRRKIDIGLADETKPEAAAFLALAESLAAEIGRLALYWNAHGSAEGGTSTVGGVVVYGGNANIKGLSAFLSRKTGLSVRMADIWQSIERGAAMHPIPQSESMRFVTVAGLAMRAVTPLL